jgi:hypothetical protein
MRRVFVETNWVVAWAAPAHQKIPAALEQLLDRAASGELTLHLPAICISFRTVPRQKGHFHTDRKSLKLLIDFRGIQESKTNPSGLLHLTRNSRTALTTRKGHG